jgi:hypothetical protein
MRKARITSIVFILTAFVAFIFSACEKADPYANLQLDIEQVARDIRESGKFVEELERLDDEAVPYVYNLGNPVKAVVYAGSGATPEEIIVVEYADEQARADGYKKLSAHLSSQRETFDDYNAEYRPLLDEPLFIEAGRYIIYCIASDFDASKAALNQHIDS